MKKYITIFKDQDLLLLLFGCCVLFLQQSWVPGFFQDGYLYAALGKNAAFMGKWLIPFQSETQYAEFNQHPPFIFMVEGLFFKVFGSSYTSARVFSGLWGIGIVVLIYRYLKYWGYRHWSLIAPVSLMVMPFFFKKIRFPNLDYPLTFFITFTLLVYFEWYRTRDDKSWIKVGLLWGFCLLVKGIIGLLVPWIIILHLLFTREIKNAYKNKWPYFGVLLGVALFSIWPLMLFFQGHLDLFYSYLDVQLFHTVVQSRGGQETGILSYVTHLLSYEAIWVFSMLIGGIKLMRDRKWQDIEVFCIVWFLGVLIPLSLIKFKYSHYILPLYPAMAILSTWFAKFLSERAFCNLRKIIQYTFFVAALVLLIFPITVNVRRDRELIKTTELLEGTKIVPKKWIVVGDIYPFWSFSGYTSFQHSGNPVKENENNFLKMVYDGKKEERVYFLSEETYLNNIEKLKNKLRLLAKFKKKNMVVLINYDLDKRSLVY